MSNNEGQIDAVQGPAEEFDPLSEMLSEMLGSEVEVEMDAAGDDADGVGVVDLPEPVETFEPVEVAAAEEAPSDATVMEAPMAPESAPAEEAIILVSPLVTQPAMEAAPEETAAEPEVSTGIDVEPVVVFVEEQPAEVVVAGQQREELPAIVVQAKPEPALETSTPSGSPGLEDVISEIDRETGLAPREEFEFVANQADGQRASRESCIVFLLDGTGYAIPIRNVLELDAMPRVTAVPNVPAFVRGITNLRGEIVAVLDLRSLLGMERTGAPQRGRILIVRSTDQLSAALAVDDVRGAASLALGELVQPASPIQGKVARVLMGVGEHQDQVLNVLDVDKLFRTPEIQQFAAN